MLLKFYHRKVNKVFKFSVEEINLAPFVGNGTKVKIPSEIKPPLENQPGVQKRMTTALIQLLGFN